MRGGLGRAWAAKSGGDDDPAELDGHVVVGRLGLRGVPAGPGLARATADVALTGSSEVLDVSDLGLDRFDEAGRSRLATDPIALPFPERIASS